LAKRTLPQNDGYWLVVEQCKEHWANNNSDLMMDILRAIKVSNNLTQDPALHLIAAKTKCYRHEVIAFWILLLEKASQENNQGELGNLDFEEIDFALDFLLGKSKKIFEALIERGKVSDYRIVNWAKHQADTSNAERQRRFRERKKDNDSNDDVTLRNVTVTESNAVTLEENRREENRRDKKEVSISPLRFDEFWQAYPKNGGSKAKSLISYKKAITKGVEENGIIERAREYNGYCQNTDTKVAHATTWLNEERWTIDYRELYRSEKRGSQQSNGEGFANQLQVTQTLAEALIADRLNRASSGHIQGNT